MTWRINFWELPDADKERELHLRYGVTSDLPPLRKQAQKALDKATAEVVEPAGYVREAKSLWVKRGSRASTYVAILKDRAGFGTSIGLGRESLLVKKIPSYQNNTAWPLNYYETSTEKGNRLSPLYYYDLAKDPEFIPYLMNLLRERGLPFLETCHGLSGQNQRPPLL